jgi:predicted Abi (CAAX) family protease
MMRRLHWYDRLAHRFRAGFGKLPTARDWHYGLILLSLFGLLYLPVGWHTGFLHWAPQLNLGVVMGVMAGAFLMPGLNEEILFRLMLLPHPTEPLQPYTRNAWTIGSWVLFVLYHVPPWTPAFFKTPIFLLGAGLVGLVCTFAYLQSRSIWTAVFIHWTIVVVWLLLFGGLRRFG